MRKLIVPIFSMRSYETGSYSVLKDGNFQLQLSRAKPGDVICVPFNAWDLKELMALFPGFTFVQVFYGENALDTRSNFWREHTEIIDDIAFAHNCDLIVTDITGYRGQHKVIFNFNITKDPEHPREYIDRFIDIDVESVNSSIKTFVLNQCQADVLIAHGAEASKIVVTQKVINKDIMAAYLSDYAPITLGNSVFHPFRISDPCYRFEDVYKYAESRVMPIFVTDPNDSLDYEKYSGAVLFKPNKRDYYRVLAGRPTIVYHENPEKVFHPGLAEFIFFNANIICEYNLPKREDVIINDGEDVWLS